MYKECAEACVKREPYDYEASELRHRRERLLALRRKREAASEGV